MELGVPAGTPNRGARGRASGREAFPPMQGPRVAWPGSGHRGAWREARRPFATPGASIRSRRPPARRTCAHQWRNRSSVDAGARGPGFPRRPAQARVEVLFHLRRPTGPLLTSRGRGLGFPGAAQPFSRSTELLTTHPGQYGTDGARGPGPQRGPDILRKGPPSPCRACGPATQTGYLPGRGSNVLVGSWGSLPPSVCVHVCVDTSPGPSSVHMCTCVCTGIIQGPWAVFRTSSH